MEGGAGGLVRIYAGYKRVVIPTLLGSTFHTNEPYIDYAQQRNTRPQDILRTKSKYKVNG